MREIYPSKKPRPRTASRIIERLNRVDIESLGESVALALSMYGCGIIPSRYTSESGNNTSDSKLHSCSDCAAESVSLMREVGHVGDSGDDSGWDLTLYCHGCGNLVSGIYGSEEVDAFHEATDERTDDPTLVRQDQANIDKHIAKFTAQLIANDSFPRRWAK